MTTVLIYEARRDNYVQVEMFTKNQLLFDYGILLSHLLERKRFVLNYFYFKIVKRYINKFADVT